MEDFIIRIRRGKKNDNLKKYFNNCLNEFELLTELIDLDNNHYKYIDKPNNLCRYSDITTYIYNKVEISSSHKYINASWIHIPFLYYFIATQGPLPYTVEDFWTMCYQYDVNMILMLCKLKEKNKEKCANYWSIKNMKNFVIKKIDEGYLDKNKDIIIREFLLINLHNKNITKNIIQIHLTSWEDHTAISPDYFDKIIEIINFLGNNKKNSPIVVHCSAGVGRTGTFISLYNLYHGIMQQIFIDKKEIIIFSIFNLVRKLKELRMNMVQNEEQYICLYHFVDYLLYLKNN